MRLLYVIMAIYLLGLSLVPCGDAFACEDEDLKMEVSSSHSDTDTDDSEHTDNCTPFCICNCCGPHVAFLSPEVFITAKLAISNPILPLFSQRTDSFFSHSIWQPPKA